jgi:hypothetical protein
MATKHLRCDPDATPIELFALARAAKAAEKVRDHLEEGTTAEVDVKLRLKGMLQIGMNEIRERSVKPELVNLLGMILEFLPSGGRRKLEKKLDSAFSLADASCWPECVPEMRILAEQAIARWSRKDEHVQRGAVTGVVTVEVLARNERA